MNQPINKENSTPHVQDWCSEETKRIFSLLEKYSIAGKTVVHTAELVNSFKLAIALESEQARLLERERIIKIVDEEIKQFLTGEEKSVGKLLLDLKESINK